MIGTPKGLRLHIGLFGRRNSGKSSLLNAITRQSVSIVSATAGTTTDPVEKTMELLPLGPVCFVDTAGLDDEGALGEQRVRRTRAVIDRCEAAILVAAEGCWGEWERQLLAELQRAGVAVVVAFNKADLMGPRSEVLEELTKAKTPAVLTDALKAEGVADLREALLKIAPDEFVSPPALVGDLLPPGELAVLVVPIDLEAPKGRLILPQVQTIRDLLDSDCYCLVVKERELRAALERLKQPPALVVTDSQAFLRVAADTPDDVPLTSFSILFARYKGDLDTFVQGARAIDHLRTGDRILIAEACTHHPIGDDIGRVKIPRWLTQYVGGKLNIDHVQGHDFPKDVSDYRLVVHCGGCVHNRRSMLTRIARCREQGVEMTNYGMCIAYSLGIFQRALRPFPWLSSPEGDPAGTSSPEPISGDDLAVKATAPH